MRILGCAGFIGFVCCALAQNPAPQAPDTAPSAGHRAQAIIQVQRDKMGANIVKISLLDPTFPPQVLQQEVDQIGRGAGSGARGVQITSTPDEGGNSAANTLRATFAVDGLVDPNGAWVRVSPIVRAMVGAPKPYEIKDFIVYFDNEIPTAKDLDSFSSATVDVHREIVPSSMEYSVFLKSQDPLKVNVPDFADHKLSDALPVGKERIDWLAVITVGVASLAAGALVYCLFLLKPSSKKGVRR